MAEDFDLAAKECYSRLGSSFKCAQEAAANWEPQAAHTPAPKKAQAPSEGELPEGEFIRFALCQAFEGLKALISSSPAPRRYSIIDHGKM